MQEGARRFEWDRRNPKPGQIRDGRWLVGMGMAAATRGNPLLRSSANVRLDPDGTATVRMAMTDIGTGTYTILAQIAAETLGLPIEHVRVELGDTDFPQAAGSGGSWGAGSSGSAFRSPAARCGKAGTDRGHGSSDRTPPRASCPRTVQKAI
jgi:xanthine dehydrogenase YagR molybdenum-binding subunit